MRSIITRCNAPAVLDADGLNAVAAAGRRALESLRRPTWPLVLTPHPGEAARLLETTALKVQGDRLSHARSLAEIAGAVVVLKGHRSLVVAPDGRVGVNSSGNPGMASAGMGDVPDGHDRGAAGTGASTPSTRPAWRCSCTATRETARLRRSARRA